MNNIESNPFKNMKIAIVHDWLVNYGGAETFVELLLEMFPSADIYTLVYDKKKLKGHFENNRIYTSKLQKIPFATKFYTKMLSLMPSAFEAFDFSSYDLVISSSSSCAKGIITPPYVPHIAYIHSPMRYAWDLYHDYYKRSGRLTRFFMNKLMPEIRLWDYISSQRIDTLIANSKYIARRIKKFWNKDASVIYSPVNVRRFSYIENTEPEDYYVTFSRLVPYKRIDLAVSACMKANKKLVVIGAGSEEENLKKMARNCPFIKFAGFVSDEDLLTYLRECKALIFCAEEDFGLIPLEAQACGRPVIAFGRGGACETVINNKTGIFFAHQETEDVVEALNQFEELDEKGLFDSHVIAEHAQSFSADRFKKEMTEMILKTMDSIKLV